jgi:hypothetical protein
MFIGWSDSTVLCNNKGQNCHELGKEQKAIVLALFQDDYLDFAWMERKAQQRTCMRPTGLWAKTEAGVQQKPCFRGWDDQHKNKYSPTSVKALFCSRNFETSSKTILGPYEMSTLLYMLQSERS